MKRRRRGPQPKQYDDIQAALKGGDVRQAEIIWRRQSKDQTRRIRAMGAHVCDELLSIAGKRPNEVTADHLAQLGALAGEMLEGLDLGDHLVRANLKAELSEHFAIGVLTDGELDAIDPNPPSLKEWVERQPEGSRVRKEWSVFLVMVGTMVGILEGKAMGSDDDEQPGV